MSETPVVEKETFEWTEEMLLALADAIGSKVKAGHLPPQDENGFYILP